MRYFFKNAEIFYRYFDKKSNVTNVYLHGWAADQNLLIFCKDVAKKQNSLFIDFPPFGKSQKQICDWTIFTYANMVISICDHLGLEKINLVGHSFGGRIGILLSVLFKERVQKLVLIDSAGIKPKRRLSYYSRVALYKIKKKLGLDISRFGSCDYQALGCDMRKIFNHIVNTHLDDFLPFVKAKTLIIFGKNDKATPVYMAKKLHKNIKGSSLVLLDNAGHFPFLDRRIEFSNLLENFFAD